MPSIFQLFILKIDYRVSRGPNQLLAVLLPYWADLVRHTGYDPPAAKTDGLPLHSSLITD
jgi:hypothetical protein